MRGATFGASSLTLLISLLFIFGYLTLAKCSRTYGVRIHSHPSGTYGVKYSHPKTHTVLQRPSSGNIKPESNIHDVSEPLYEPTHEEYEPTYELVYEPVPRNNPKHVTPEIQHHVIHIHHHDQKHPY